MVWSKVSRQIKVTFLLKSIMSQVRPLRKNLANIAPCSFAEDGCNDQTYVNSVRPHPTHGFMLEKEIPNTELMAKGLIPPTGRNV